MDQTDANRIRSAVVWTVRGKTMEWLEPVPQIPLQCLGGASLQGMVKSDGTHPVWASSLPAFSTDLHKHHLTAHRETHLKPGEERKKMTWDQTETTGPSPGASYFREHYETNRNVSCQHTWGTLTPARMWTGLRVMCSCVHVNVHLHLVVQDLHKLLHWRQMTRFQFGPHWHI